jgi:DNA polymerase-3 subunit beta
MHLNLRTASFLEELQAAARVASTRSAVQALSGVQLHAEDGVAELRATDMEVGVRLPLDASIESPGAVVLPARLLLDVIRSLTGDTVSVALRAAEGDVEITSAGATFRLRTLRNEDFPNLPAAGEGGVSLESQPFIDTVERVSRSASRDDTRPVLTGILVSASEHELRMVATDSYRLSVKTTRLVQPIAAPLEANVPARALAEVVRIAQQSEVPSIAITRTENQIVFSLGGAVLSSRLIDGQFPNYQLLLPETAGVVRRISLLAQKNAPLRLSFSEGELLVSAQTPDVGDAREALPVPFSGEPFEIGFNADFLRDGLESVDSDDVLIKLTSALRPGLIESADESQFVYLVMPIRLNT